MNCLSLTLKYKISNREKLHIADFAGATTKLLSNSQTHGKSKRNQFIDLVVGDLRFCELSIKFEYPNETERYRKLTEFIIQHVTHSYLRLRIIFVLSLKTYIIYDSAVTDKAILYCGRDKGHFIIPSVYYAPQ
jgi:hypothetical protein